MIRRFPQPPARGAGSPPTSGRELEPDDERRLVERCHAGEGAALDDLFRLYVRRVERVVGRMVGATPDFEDLVQNTFVEAVRSLPSFRGEASLGTWLTRIAVHVVHRQLRRGVRRMVPLESVPPAEAPHAAGPSPERAIDDRRTAQRLHVMLDRVAPKKRIAFLLYTVEERSIAEVAALTGAREGTVKSRIWFARRELMAMLRRDPAMADVIERFDRPGSRPDARERPAGDDPSDDQDGEDA